MLGLHTPQIFVDIDFLLILTSVYQDLQGDCASSAVFLQDKRPDFLVPDSALLMRWNLADFVGYPDRGSKAIS